MINMMKLLSKIKNSLQITKLSKYGYLELNLLA